MNNQNTKIIGIKNLMNFEYQKQIHSKTNEIMQNQNEISTESLKTNSVFTNLCNDLDSNAKNKLFDKIVNLAGNFIDKMEMKTILYLLDANLEQVVDKKTLVKSEKFVMDTRFDINNQSGIFQATPNEIKQLMQLPSFFDFDNGEYFPSLQEDESVIFYDRNGNPIQQIQKKDIMNQIP